MLILLLSGRLAYVYRSCCFSLSWALITGTHVNVQRCCCSGGGELGPDWYEQGKLMHKLNTFKDFIAAAHWAIDARYSQPKLMAAKGTSAGGLVLGTLRGPSVHKMMSLDCMSYMSDVTFVYLNA